MNVLKGPALALAFVVVASPSSGDQTGKTESTWGACSQPPIEPCFTHRGRLSAQNGIAHMIWLVGTKRIVAVDNEVPGMLLNYLDMTSAEHSDIYGDYELCPVEHDRAGYMRRVCVVGASRLVAQDRDRTRPPVRLLATWSTENR